MENKMYAPKAVAVYRAVLSLAGSGADLSAMKVQQIADAAGVGKGTLYEYFPSKEAILQGTLHYCMEQELARLTLAAPDAADFAHKVNGTLEYIRGLVGERFAAYEMVMGVLNRGAANPGAPAADCPAKQPILDLLHKGYESALAAGMSPDTTAVYFDYAVISAMAGYAVGLRLSAGDPAQAGQLLADTRTLLSRALGIAL